MSYSDHILLVLGLLLFSYMFFRPQKKSRYYLYLVFVMLVLLRSLIVYNTWDDLHDYADEYKICSESSLSKMIASGWRLDIGDSEKGWVVYNWVIAQLSSDFYFFLFVTALIITYAYISSMKSFLMPNFYMLAVVLYFLGPYTQSIFVLRQHLSMAIVLLAYPLLLKNRYIQFALVVVIAFFLHSSALIALPLAFFYNIRKTKLLIFALVVYSIIIIVSISTFANYAFDYIPRMEAYLDVDAEMVTNAKSAMLLSVLLAFRFYILKKDFFKPGIIRLFSIILVLGAVNAIAGVGVGTFMSRLNMYFSEMTFLFFPETLSHIKSTENKRAFSLMYVCFVFLFFYQNIQLYNKPNYSLFLW